MPIGSNGQVTVDVGVKLQVLQSSVNELQKVLDKLQPNSSGFKTLSTILTNARKEMEKLQVQTSKPFTNQSQFNQTEKTIDRIENSLERAKLAIDKIDFSDLKLTKEQQDQFNNLKQQITDTKKALEEFQKQKKFELFENVDFKKFADSIDPKLIEKNFNEVSQVVSKRAKEIEEKLTNYKSQLTQKMALVNAKEKASSFQGLYSVGENGKKSVANEFEEYIGISAKNGAYFKHKDSKNQLVEYLKTQYALNPEQLNEIIQAAEVSAKKLNEVLTRQGFFDIQIETGEKAAGDIKRNKIKENIQELENAYSMAAPAAQQLKKAQQEVETESKKTENSVKGLEQGITNLEKSLTKTAKTGPEVERSMRGSSAELERFKQTLGDANAQFIKLQQQQRTFESIKQGIINFMGFNQVLNITKNAIRAAINHIKELDTTMNGIAIVTDMTTADLWKQVDAYSTMAQNFGVTIQGAYEVSKIYYQAGYETNDVLTLTNETLKLAKISGLDYATTTDYMMTAMRGFKLEMEDASRVVDVYSNLAANTAVSQKELAEAMTRTASSMQSVGATFEDTSAMIATMVAVTRESASNIGSAMKSIASRYGELTKDPTKLVDEDGEAMAFNKVDAALQSVGISMKTVDGQFRDFTSVIVELAEKWDTLDSVSQRYIATQFAGNRQQSRFLALVSNIDLLKENMANAENSEDIGTLQALKALDSLESKINQVQVAYQQFYTTIGIENAWKSFLDGAKNVINTLNGLPKVFDKIPAAAVVVVLNGINLIKAALLHGLTGIVSVWKGVLNQASSETQSAVSRQQIEGQNYIQKFIDGIKSQKNALQDTVKSLFPKIFGGLELSQDQQWKINSLSTIGGRTDAALARHRDTSIDAKVRKAELQELYREYQKLGLIAGGEVPNNIEKLSKALREQGLNTETAKKYLEDYNNQLKAQEQERFRASAIKTSSALAQIGSAFSTLSLFLNNGSEKGRVMTGVMMTLGGAISAVGAVIRAVSEKGTGWIGLALTAITTIISGISTWVETAAEKIERLEKEAEDLNNQAKEVKANYNTLDRTAKKLDELQAKRYENAEAAEEYQKAIDELADTFPQLISGFDEAGEVIIDTTDMEVLLAEARRKSAEAAYDAAQKEYELAEERTKQKQKEAANEAQGILNEAGTEISFSPEKDKIYKNNLKNAYSLFDDTLTQEQKNQAAQELRNFINTNKQAIKDIYQAKGQNLTDEQIKKEFANYNSPANTQYQKEWEKLERLEEDLDNWFKANQEYYDNVKVQQAQASSLVARYANTTLNGGSEWSYLKNSSLSTIFNKKYGQEFISSGLSWSDWLKTEQANGMREAQLNYEDFWSNLTETEQKRFTEMLSDRKQYTYGDIEKEFEDKKFWSGIENDLFNFYLADQQIVSKRIAENLNLKTQNKTIDKDFADKIQAVAKAREEKNELSRQDENFFDNLIKGYEDVAERTPGKLTDYQTNVTKLLDAYDTASTEVQDGFLLLVEKYGLSTTEGIDKILAETTDKEIIAALTNFKNSIVKNFALSIQSMLDNAQTKWSDAKDITNFRSGVSIDKLGELFSQFSILDISLTMEDLERDGNKFIVSAEKYQEFWNAYVEQNFSKPSQEMENFYESLQGLELDENSILEFQQNEDFFTHLGLDIKDYFDNGELIDDANIDALNTAIDNFRNNYSQYTQVLVSMGEAITRDTQFAVGKYEDFFKSVGNELSKEELTNIASGATKLDKSAFNERAAKDSLNKAYSSLISDVLSKGFENINIADYEGLFEGEEVAKTSYEEFVKTYAGLAGKTIEETNALIVQAIQKDTESTSGAAQEALAQVDFYTKDIAYASLDTIKKLADALGIGIDQIKGKYVEELDQYQVKDIEKWSAQITNSTDIFFDSVNSVINSITKYISSGLGGKLQGKDVTNLNAQLEAFGINKLNESDFSKTVEGLKLSEQAAIRLYSELKNIDAIQAQITFNDLSKSLQENNEHYKDASDILVRIKQLNDELAKPNISDARRKEYERELVVAKEIAAVRLGTEDKSYKFMDNNLPANLQNQVDYIDAYGKMFKSINNAAKDGKMDVTDFYNTVNELNNLAAISGKPIKFMGEELNGDLTSAADLIEKGFSALTNIDGEGAKVDFSKLGLKFADGADLLQGNVEEGIRTLASSQIDMLDAMIQLLETVVAMEELGNIDVNGNGIEFGEMFDTIGDKFAATSKMKDAVNNILSLAKDNDQLKKALEEFKINNKSLTQIFKELAAGVPVTETEANLYFQALTSLYQMAKDGNYDLNNLTQSIQQIATQSGLIGEIELNGIKFDFNFGESATSTDGNKWTYKGQEYTNKNDLYKAMAAEALGVDKTEEITFDGTEASRKIGVEQSIEMTVAQNGKITYTSEKLGTFDSIEDLLDAAIATGKYGENHAEAALKLGITAEYKAEKEAEKEVAQSAAEAMDEAHKANIDTFTTKVSELTTNFVNNLEKIGTNFVNQIADALNGKKIENTSGGKDNSPVATLKTQNQPTSTLSDKAVMQATVAQYKKDAEAVAAAQAEAAEYKAQAAAMQSDYSEARQRAENAAVALAEVQSSANSLQEQLDQSKHAYEVLDGINTELGEKIESLYETLAIQANTIDKFEGIQEELDASKRAYDELSKANDELREKITELYTTIAVQAQTIDNFEGIQEKLNEVSTAYDNLYKTNESLVSRISQLSETIAIQASTIDELEGIQEELDAARRLNSELSAANDNLVARLAASEAEKVSIQNSLSALEEEKARLEQIRADDVRAYEVYTSQILDLQDQIDNLRAQQILSNREIQEKAQENESLSAQLTLTQEALEKQKALHNDNLDTIKALEAQSAELQDINADLLGQVQSKTEEISRLRMELNDSASGNEEYLALNQKLEQSLADARSVISENDKIIAGKEAEINDLNDTINKYEGQLKASATVEESLRESLADIQKENESLAQTNSDLSEQVSNAAKELALKQQQLDALTLVTSAQFETIGELNAEIASLQEANSRLTKENNDLTKDYDTVSAALRQVQDQVAQWRTELMNQPNSEVIDFGAKDQIITNLTEQLKIAVEIGDDEAAEQIEKLLDDYLKYKEEIESQIPELKVDNKDANNELDTTRNKAIATDSAVSNVNGTGYFDGSQIISTFDEIISKGKTATAIMAGASSAAGNVSVSTGGSGSGGGARDNAHYVKEVWAKGNVALAKGRQTLMGELGPELVVSNGRYFVAGQNGAEFVNLADDAIVFNHLQTKRLLQSGSAGRGKAVVSDKKAVSLATGNTQGPAMASASAALAELKKIRAMWSALLDASISDLGSKAGLGKSGGGGGKDKDKGLKLDSGYIKDLERWYNLLRKIERVEQDINYEEKLRSKYMADSVSRGKEITQSYIREFKNLQDELSYREELAGLKKGYYEQKMQDTAAGPWGQIFTFDENGAVQIKEGALRTIAEVFASDETGAALHSARQQYQMLQDMGYGQLMQYKDDGSRIEWTDDEGKPREEAYKEAVEAFSSHMDAYSEELQSLREEYMNEMESLLDIQIKQNEIANAIRDNQIEVEQKVMDALVESREREIDELQKQRDAIADSTDKFINGLTDQMNKEREMYESQQSSAELIQLRRQLAILQRSGGSSSQIRNLQKQIEQREQEAYFEEQASQIDAIKEASDLELERLDAQISLMQETLEYQKTYGLLWDQVKDIMDGSPEEIANYIASNTSKYWGFSETTYAKEFEDMKKSVDQWVEWRTENENPDKDSTISAISDAITQGIEALVAVKSINNANVETRTVTGDWNPATTTSKSGGTSGGTGNSGTSATKKSTSSSTGRGTSNTSQSDSLARLQQSQLNSERQEKAQAELASHGWILTDNGSLVTYGSSVTKALAQEALNRAVAEYRKTIGSNMSGHSLKWEVYKKGGIIDYTGPAWVDGTKSEPEGVLNAEQLNMLRNMVLTPKNPLTGLLSDLSNSVGNTASSDTYNSINTNGAIIIENASVNMNVQKISNDYDTKRAMDTAMERMIEIARKSSTTSVRR